MSCTVEKISSNQVKMNITIPAEDFAKGIDKSYRALRGRINVPGFRRGKAPRAVIERLYGKEIFYEDAVNDWLESNYAGLLDEHDVRAVDQPKVDIDWSAIKPDTDVAMTAVVYVYPDVKLGEYKNLTVEISREKVTDAEINARIERDRAKVSRVEEVLDRPVQEGDTVNLDYAGTVDGVAFDGGTAEGQTLTIGSHQFIPGFEEQMVGMCVAEERDLNVTFPETYHAENLAGKAAVFHVKVNSISKTELPELDDEFAADVSDFTNFADYRQSIVDELQKKADENNQTAAENAVADKAAENAEVDIPQAMINDEVNNILRSMQMQMAYQGIKMEDYLKWTGMTVEQLAAQYQDEAKRRVKTQLVVESIREAEGIEANEDEVEAEYARQAESNGIEVEKLKESLTDAQKENFKNAANVVKTLKLMLETATVNDRPEEKEENKEDEA